jgi:hypothetical protein
MLYATSRAAHVLPRPACARPSPVAPEPEEPLADTLDRLGAAVVLFTVSETLSDIDYYFNQGVLIRSERESGFNSLDLVSVPQPQPLPPTPPVSAGAEETLYMLPDGDERQAASSSSSSPPSPSPRPSRPRSLDRNDGHKETNGGVEGDGDGDDDEAISTDVGNGHGRSSSPARTLRAASIKSFKSDGTEKASYTPTSALQQQSRPRV